MLVLILVSWIIDTGATSHLYINKSLFLDLTHVIQPITLHLPDGTFRTINQTGNINFIGGLILLDTLLHLILNITWSKYKNYLETTT